MTTIKRIMAAGILCSVLFTGCGMADNAADMAKEISVPTLNTEQDVNAVLAEVQSEGTPGENWILNKEKQQKLKKLYDFVKAEKAKGTLKVDAEDKAIQKWINTDDPRDDVFEYEPVWNLEIDRDYLKSFFQKIDELGYTGVYDMVGRKLDEAKKEYEEDDYWWPDTRCYTDNISFYISFMEEPYATVTIGIDADGIRYPSNLQEVLENKLQSGFLVSGVSTGGYLQSVSFYSEMFLEGSPYNKSAVLYLKDGKAVQLDMYIQLPAEIEALQEEGKLEGRFEGRMDTFFTEPEAKSVAELLEMFGVNSSDALEFAQKAGTDTETRGILNDVSWQLKEGVLQKWNSYEKTWLLRIQ